MQTKKFDSINSDMLGKNIVFSMSGKKISGLVTAIIYPGVRGEKMIVMDAKRDTSWLNPKSKFTIKIIPI